MARNTKKQIYFLTEKILKILVLLLVFSIPLGTRKFLYPFWGTPSELTAGFLYGTDILLFIVFLLFLFLRLKDQKKKKINIFDVLIFIFLFFSGFSIFFAGFKILASYAFLRIIIGTVFLFILSKLLQEKIILPREIFGAIFLAALFQSFIAFGQFFYQKSLGLRFLGESVISYGVNNVARVNVSGADLLRSYGTMAHANILAAFLGIGILSLCALWFLRIKRESFISSSLFALGFFTLFFALTLTFSRSGWISMVFVLCMLFLFLIFRDIKKETIRLSGIILLSALFVFLSMQWALLPRMHLSPSEPSVSMRVLYNKLGFSIIKNHPLGVGVGNQLFFSESNNLFDEFGIVEKRDYQPIHNLYLIIAVELGIQGLIALLAIVFLVFSKSLKFLFKNQVFLISFGMMVFVLVFGLFDHFFWTLESGRLMMFMILGSVVGIMRSLKQEDEQKMIKL